MRIVYKVILKLCGWTVPQEGLENLPKAVLVAAPHTSNLDFIIGYMTFRIMRRRIKFLIKKEAFKGPMGWFIKSMGGIPVDRHKKTNLVDQVVDIINEHEDILIMFTPEGTRKYNADWKSGFYWVALKAKVPIQLCLIDYKRKFGGFGPRLIPSGDYETDLAEMKAFASTITARVPENGVRWPED